MEFSVKNNSFYNRRPQSSCSVEVKTANIMTKNYLIRDEYKQKMLRQRQNDLALMRKYRKNIDKRSAKRFSNSPFAVNILADNEIQEHERNMVSRTRKTKSLVKNAKKASRTQKYLLKLRGEIKKINEGKWYIEEKHINSQILTQKSTDKLKRARKARENSKKEYNSFSNMSKPKATDLSSFNKLDDLLNDLDIGN
ncbi:hypothetical protein SteCoe_29755 [Stentor coeruleus]|uniref:Uncharacterized protein n=1 Tax=Stentor coeruleus TaxID=5963 RepID=A0A1R2B564_9CILI|nr:hypothetical protein SteCoe_29755 [Stentor coeruleus]